MGHAFVLEKSLDGKNWQPLLEEKTRAFSSPHTNCQKGKTRYLPIHIQEGNSCHLGSENLQLTQKFQLTFVVVNFRIAHRKITRLKS